jgi:hypothetical protein
LSSWQAIETAPKDGSDFIGMRRDGERLLTHTTRMALYSGHHLWECLEFDAVSPWSPTHWMPLPGIATVETTAAPIRPYGEEVAPAGPWRVVRYGSPPDKGDMIFDEHGCIAHFGDQHHEAVGRIVYEHNVSLVNVNDKA